jgi:hypothetical protein
MDIKIIQTSLQHTGSTVLTNLLFGAFESKSKVNFLHIKKYSHNIVKNKLIYKSHVLDINKILNFPYNIYIIMSSRKEKDLDYDISYYKNPKILIIDYEKLNETPEYTLKDIVDYTFMKFKNFLPKELFKLSDKEIKKNMYNRISRMNKVYKKIRDKPFSYVDTFYSLHGSHRNRYISTDNLNPKYFNL